LVQEKVSPDPGKVFLVQEKVSPDKGKVFLVQGKVSPDRGKVFLVHGKVSHDREKVFLVQGKVSPDEGNVCKEIGNELMARDLRGALMVSARLCGKSRQERDDGRCGLMRFCDSASAQIGRGSVVVQFAEVIRRTAPLPENRNLASLAPDSVLVASAKLPLASAKLPLASVKLPLASAKLPLASVKLPLASASGSRVNPHPALAEFQRFREEASWRIRLKPIFI